MGCGAHVTALRRTATASFTLQQAVTLDVYVCNFSTDNSEKAMRFARQQKVALLSRQFLDRLEGRMDLSERLSLEQFLDCIRRYPEHKQVASVKVV